jgi:transcriptional regulator with XRE-family HTH domain
LNRIKQLRAEKNINQDVLAKLLGIEVAGISKLETGRVPLKDDYILKLAEYFDVNTDYLLGKSDIRNIEQEYKFAYHKEDEGLTEEEIKEALKIYKQIKYGNLGKKKEEK